MKEWQQSSPVVEMLRKYDIVLSSQQRCGREDKDEAAAGSSHRLIDSRRSRPAFATPHTRPMNIDRTDSVTTEYYTSPLSDLPGKSLIIDEGHNHDNSDISRAAVVADQLIVERR